MDIPVLNYSTPRDDEAVRRKRREHSWWLRGVLYSFSFTAGIMVMVAYLLGHAYRWNHYLPESFAVFLCGLGILIYAERIVRRHQNSTAFARGAFIGGLLPGGLAVIMLAFAMHDLVRWLRWIH